jgi:hypothetical protein
MPTRLLALPLLAAALLLGACEREGATTPPSDSDEDRAAFIAAWEFGYNFHEQSRQLRAEGIELNDAAILAGFRAGLRTRRLRRRRSSSASASASLCEWASARAATVRPSSQSSPRARA